MARRIELLEEAVRLDPTDPLPYYTLGAKLEKAGRYEDAVKLYRAAIGKGIENARLHSRLGDLLVRAGRKAEAIPEYETAARINPADATAQINLATAMMEQGRASDAERVFKAVAAIDPSNAAAPNGLGILAIQRQDAAGACGYFEQAVGLDPDGGTLESGAALQDGWRPHPGTRLLRIIPGRGAGRSVRIRDPKGARRAGRAAMMVPCFAEPSS